MKTRRTCIVTLIGCRDCHTMLNKSIFVVGIILSTLMLKAQEPAPTAFEAVTNIVKAPVTTRDLYQKSSKATDISCMKDAAVVRSLRFFKESQNSDGSWGNTKEQGLATPLVLLSFLGHGETTASHNFSNTVARAREWIMKSNPTETAQQLVTIVSLSAYCDLSYISTHPEQKATELAKINALLKMPQETNSEIWVDFASFHTMPADISKPSWMRRTKATQDKYRSVSSIKSPQKVDDYLERYLVRRAIFHHGGKSYQELARTETLEYINRQQPDGSYPVSAGQDRFAATALATLQLEINYQYEPR